MLGNGVPYNPKHLPKPSPIQNHREVTGKYSLSGKRGVPRGNNGGNALTSPTLRMKDSPSDQLIIKGEQIMTKIIGVSKVICTCGKEMERTGGVFGELTYSTYICRKCDKAVNVYDLPNTDFLKE